MCVPRVITDPDLGREVWCRTIPNEVVTDLWEFRECFYSHYKRPLCFLVHEDARGIGGFLPLCWIEEAERYGYFPGETWRGKTWIEQNRLVVRDLDVLRELIKSCPGPLELRYLSPPMDGIRAACPVDEVGYLFLPPKFGFSMENYFREFSPKTAKKLRREVDAMAQRGVEFRCDDESDFDPMVQLSLVRFGADSYFADPRFRESFRSVMRLLAGRGWLRMTAVLIEGTVAAVDLGCVYRGVYTLLAGGAHPDYRGVAKLINLHHMERACRERLQQVDFLCGDFCWKTLFHLTPRPLHVLSNVVATSDLRGSGEIGSPAVA